MGTVSPSLGADPARGDAPDLNRRTLAVLAAGCGLSVANLYYGQPLLPQFARAFGAEEGAIGLVAALTQAGYAAGLLAFVPLGDTLERRGLILTLLAASVVAMVAVAFASSLPWLAVASFLVGFTGVTPQLLVPFAALLARPADRGRAVGTVMGGLLIGVLLSRTVGGLLGSALGWRAVYGLAAGATALLAVALRFQLPVSRSAYPLSYRQLLGSLPGLLRAEPVLQEAALFGAASFGAFSAFWTTLAFFLAAPPYEYGGAGVGWFGLLGVAGALAAPLVGRWGDRRSPRRAIGLGLVCLLLAFLEMWTLGDRLAWLVVGVVVLDLGAQAVHVSNQARLFALREEIHSRLNTVYMVAFFIGGWASSSAAALAWGRWGWGGVCAVVVALVAAALGVYLVRGRWAAR